MISVFHLLLVCFIEIKKNEYEGELSIEVELLDDFVANNIEKQYQSCWLRYKKEHIQAAEKAWNDPLNKNVEDLRDPKRVEQERIQNIWNERTERRKLKERHRI